MLFQKLGGGHAQAVLETNNVIGCQGNVGLFAAGVETGYAGIAVEADLALQLQLTRLDRAVERDVFKSVVTHYTVSQGCFFKRAAIIA